MYSPSDGTSSPPGLYVSSPLTHLTPPDVSSAFAHLMSRDCSLLAGLSAVLRDLAETADRGGRVLSEMASAVASSAGAGEEGPSRGYEDAVECLGMMGGELFRKQCMAEAVKGARMFGEDDDGEEEVREVEGGGEAVGGGEEGEEEEEEGEELEGIEVVRWIERNWREGTAESGVDGAVMDRAGRRGTKERRAE